MRLVVDQRTLEDRIQKYEEIMRQDDEAGSPPLLLNLKTEREKRVSREAYTHGFNNGVHRGVYETLKSLREVMLPIGEEEEESPLS